MLSNSCLCLIVVKNSFSFELILSFSNCRKRLMMPKFGVLEEEQVHMSIQNAKYESSHPPSPDPTLGDLDIYVHSL